MRPAQGHFYEQYEAAEPAPLFKADGATLSFYATKKVSVSYQGWDQARLCSTGNSSPWAAGGRGGGIVDAHPRRLLTLNMTPSFIRAHGTGLRG
jgi:hypothetical protein